MMLNKNKWVIALIAGLLVFNLWQWWPEYGTLLKNPGDQVRRIQAMDIHLAAYAPDGDDVHVVQRDLFTMLKPLAPPMVKPERVKSEQKVQNRPEVHKAGKYKKQPVNDRTQSDVNQYKLVGVLFQGSEKSAYLLKGEIDYSVKKGDRLEGRYLVKDVTVSSVTLLDIKSRKSSIINMQ